MIMCLTQLDWVIKQNLKQHERWTEVKDNVII